MQIRSWQGDNRSARQEISRLSWISKIYYLVHNNPPSVLSLSCKYSMHRSTIFLATYFNIILPPLSRSSKFSLPFRSSDKNFVFISHLSQGVDTYINITSNFIQIRIDPMKSLLQGTSSRRILKRRYIILREPAPDTTHSCHLPRVPFLKNPANVKPQLAKFRPFWKDGVTRAKDTRNMILDMYN